MVDIVYYLIRGFFDFRKGDVRKTSIFKDKMYELSFLFLTIKLLHVNWRIDILNIRTLYTLTEGGCMGKLFKKTSILICLSMLTGFAQSGGKLLDSINIEYAGSFNVPHVSGSENSFTWVGNGLAYNKANNSIFITGHDYYNRVGEISVPTIDKATDAADLPTAELLQPVADIAEGHIAELGEGGAGISNNNHNIKVGGLLVYGNELIASAYPYYEDAWEAVRSHFKSGLDLDLTGDYDGMYKVGNLPSGTVNGYMATIPEPWQDSLNAPCLTGNACLAIIGRSSMGPSISTFTPELLKGNGDTISKELVYYTEDHATLGQYTNEDYANPLYCMSSRIYGVVFPKGSRTILFIGRTGLGVPEYGAGTDDIALDGTPVPNYPDEYYIYDPAAPSKKGAHAWPYRAYIWAYSADELMKVYRDELEPWDVVPYRHWAIDLPYVFDESEFLLGGAAYDEDNQRIFISEKRAYKDQPVIHVLNVNDKDNDLAIVSKSSGKKSFRSISIDNRILKISTGDISSGNYSLSITLVNGKRVNLSSQYFEPNKVYKVALGSNMKEKIASGIYLLEMKSKEAVYRSKNFSF